MISRIPSNAWRYALALALSLGAVALAVVVSPQRPAPDTLTTATDSLGPIVDGSAGTGAGVDRDAMERPIDALFYAVVMLSAWFGGIGPGLLAAAVASWWISREEIAAANAWHIVSHGAMLIGLALLISVLDATRRRAAGQRDQFVRREHRARTVAETEQRRSAFLAQASSTLASSLDYRTTLTSVARLVVPYLADWCMVDVVEPGGELRRLAVAHADPGRAEADLHVEDRPLSKDQTPSRVVRTGVSDFVPDVSEQLLATHAKDERNLDVLRTMGIRSYMSVPLVARGRTLGAITFATAESRRAYGHDDLRLAEDLAARAAIAVDNARLYHEAQEANRMKDEFLATISHELRTPLNAVLGWTQLLRVGDLDEHTVAQAIDTIERNAKAQARIVEDVLDVSRIIQGKLRLNVGPVDLASVIGATVNAIRPAAQGKEIALYVDVDPGAQGVQGDPDRLQQIVWNLLSNAIKFTDPGGRVDLAARREGERVTIRVRDTGHGIDPKFLPHVFERFRQFDSSTTRSHGGLGLGLAIVRHLAELHGGTVMADSAGRDCGATFTVTLPAPIAAPPDDSPDSGTGATGASTAAATTTSAAPKLRGLRVLVVDDEIDTLELLRTVLGQLGAAVTTARSAREAIEAMERLHLDVVISDIGMPEEDGYEMMRRIRMGSDARAARIPAVALTAYASAADRSRALSSGYQVHIAKPVEPTVLGDVVARITGRAASPVAAPYESVPGPDIDTDDTDADADDDPDALLEEHASPHG